MKNFWGNIDEFFKFLVQNSRNFCQYPSTQNLLNFSEQLSMQNLNNFFEFTKGFVIEIHFLPLTFYKNEL